MKKIFGILFVIIILGYAGYFVYVNYIKDSIPKIKIEEETANDLWSALYNFGVNLGDASGPLIGGFITEKKGFETACFYMSVANFSWFFVFIISSLKTIKEEIKCKNLFY